MFRSAYVRSSRVALSCQNPVVCAVLLGLGGCSGDPAPSGENKAERIAISSQGAALTAVQNTEIALKGVVDSGSFLADSTSLAETLNAMGFGSEVCESTSTPCSSTDTGCVPEATEVCTTDEITAEEMQEAREELRQEVDELVKHLREEVFIDANLVADDTTETQVTYRLGSDVLCPVEPSEQPAADPSVTTEPAQEPAPDPECVANAEKANLRIRLTQPKANDVDMTIVAGDGNFEPVVLQLYHDRIGVKVDLAESLKTLEAMGENVEEVTSLTGILQLQLVKNAAIDYSLQFSVLADVSVSLENEAGDQYAYSLAKSSPTVELRADGNTKTVSASYNYGAIQILGPFAEFVESYLDGETATASPEEAPGVDALPQQPSYTGVVELLLAGYTGKVSYTADSDTFVFSEVSLGDSTSTLEHNGNVLAALDLNPSDGRKFNATVSAQTLADGSKSALVSLDPTIDLNLALSFSHIADQVADLSPTLLNDKLRMWFEGTDPTFAVEGDRLRMVAGSFHSSSEQNAETNIDVAEGMCLEASDPSVSVGGDTTGDMSENLFDVSVTTCE